MADPTQTKDTLTLRASSFGSKCELPTPFIDKVAKSGVMDAVMSFASYKNNRELKKGDGAKRQHITGIPKLDDANDAGGRNSEQCTLILTEGDSAKTLAISGLSVVGRDHYGVFPLRWVVVLSDTCRPASPCTMLACACFVCARLGLGSVDLRICVCVSSDRGKLLNVRDASATQITGNAEIQAIKQILGLQHGKVCRLCYLSRSVASSRCAPTHGTLCTPQHILSHTRAHPHDHEPTHRLRYYSVYMQVYSDAKSLRYGHLMIMTDQDHDGSHIKGLIMNFLHAFYPSLLKVPGFLLQFITPIIKVCAPSHMTGQAHYERYRRVA